MRERASSDGDAAEVNAGQQRTADMAAAAEALVAQSLSGCVYWVEAGGRRKAHGGARPDVALVSAAPSILITAVAGLAVLGALVTSVVNAMEDPRHRVTAIGAFLVVASGIVILNLGSAFWGLLIGGIVMAWLSWNGRRARGVAL